MKCQPVHHWAIEQNSKVGKLVPDAIKNQPWNLNPLPDQATHNRIHGLFGEEQYNAFGRWWEGTPRWAKALELDATGKLTDSALDLGE